MLMNDIEIFWKKKKIKSANMVTNNVKIFLKIKKRPVVYRKNFSRIQKVIKTGSFFYWNKSFFDF